MVVKGNLIPLQCLFGYVILEKYRETGTINNLAGAEDMHPSKAAGCPRAVPATVLPPYSEIDMAGYEDKWNRCQEMARIGIMGSHCKIL